MLNTADLVAFLDHRPVFKGHVLLVTKRHVETLTDLPDDLLVALFTATRRVAAAVCEALGAQGSFVAMNNVVSQSVPHLHVHVVPPNEGRRVAGFLLAAYDILRRRRGMGIRRPAPAGSGRPELTDRALRTDGSCVEN